ncbi:MAG: Fic family protein [Chloroflexota bacterium]
MLRPRFRYSHDLVGKLLQAEHARGALPPPNYIGSNSNDCPSEDTLYELRATLGDNKPGYRRGSALIFNQARTDIVYVPPEAPDVPDLMGQLTDWLDGGWDSVPGIVLAGVLEEEILLIQPFEHDNGALARLAGDTVLRRKGYGFAPVQAHMSKDPRGYVEASHSSHSGAYSELADLSRWLEYFAGEVAGAAEQARLSALGGQPAPRAAAGQEAAYAGPTILRDRQIQALRYIRENGAIRSGIYQRLAGIVPDTARRDFDDLLAKGLVEVRGVGRATHYLLTQRGADEAERRRVS